MAAHELAVTSRRGAALVVVLIFGLGVLVLVSGLLLLCQTSSRVESELQREQDLQAVLRAGVATSLNEINRQLQKYKRKARRLSQVGSTGGGSGNASGGKDSGASSFGEMNNDADLSLQHLEGKLVARVHSTK